MTIREAQQGDIPDMFQIRLAVRENAMTLQELEEYFGVTPESIDRFLAEEGRGWMAEESGEAVGFSLGSRKDRSLFALFVLPEFEGRGIGTALMQAAVDWLHGQKLDEITIDTEDDPATRANALYRLFGAIRVDSVVPGNFRYRLPLPARKHPLTAPDWPPGGIARYAGKSVDGGAHRPQKMGKPQS